MCTTNYYYCYYYYLVQLYNSVCGEGSQQKNIYKTRRTGIDIRVVRKCTKYMISNKSNLQHVTFSIKIHVVGCFDPLRPSGLS